MIAALLGAALAAGPALTHQTLGVGLPAGSWSLEASLGLPNTALTGRYGWGAWTMVGELTTGLGADHWAMAGLGRSWVERPRVRLGGEALVGYHLRTGELAMRGGALELRAMVARNRGVVVPYAALDSRHTLLLDRTLVASAAGMERSFDASHRWSPVATVGLGLALRPGFGLDLGLDLPWLDPPGFSIPGAHLGVHFTR